MRAFVQRVSRAEVAVDSVTVGKIGTGLLVFLGIGREDDASKIPILAKKIVELRIFEDERAKMNLSLSDLHAEILVISQFTLYANCTRGRRPDFTQAAPPELARTLFDSFVEHLRTMGYQPQTGVFGADMKVDLLNDGPVTLLLEV